MGDFRSAEEAYAALELAHSSPRILFNLGGALEEWNDMRGPGTIRRTVRWTSYAGAYAKLGGLCQRAGDRRCARANYASFLRHWRGEEAVATTFDEGSKRCPSRAIGLAMSAANILRQRPF